MAVKPVCVGHHDKPLDEREHDPTMEALQAENPGTDFHAMDGYCFEHEGHAQECLLPEDHRFVVVIAGFAPQPLHETTPGTYVFMAPPAPEGGTWPQMVMVVKNEHLKAVLNMGGDQTAELIKMILGEAKGH